MLKMKNYKVNPTIQAWQFWFRMSVTQCSAKNFVAKMIHSAACLPKPWLLEADNGKQEGLNFGIEQNGYWAELLLIPGHILLLERTAEVAQSDRQSLCSWWMPRLADLKYSAYMALSYFRRPAPFKLKCWARTWKALEKAVAAWSTDNEKALYLY